MDKSLDEIIRIENNESKTKASQTLKIIYYKENSVSYRDTCKIVSKWNWGMNRLIVQKTSWRNRDGLIKLNISSNELCVTRYVSSNSPVQVLLKSEAMTKGVTLSHQYGIISNINRRYTSLIQDEPVASNKKILLSLLFSNSPT